MLHLTQTDRDKLIHDNMHYARSLAARIRQQLSPNLDLDELAAYGSQGLVEAANRFDPQKGTAFTTFAYYRIRGAIYDGLREQGWLNRSEYARFQAASNELMQNLCDRETQSEAQPDTKQNVQNLADTLGQITTVFVTSFCGPDSPEPADMSLTSADELVDQKRSHNAVHKALETLPDKERHLIQLSYFEGLSLKSAGEKMGLSKSWASRLHARAIQLLCEAMDSQQS